MSVEQAEVAGAYIAQLNQSHLFKKPIVTKIEPDRVFYPAEPYHQDDLFHNPRARCIVVNDLPKIADLNDIFPELYREQPVLVSEGRRSNWRCGL